MIADKLYNRLKWLAQIVLPALGVLFFLVSQSEIVGAILVINLLLGVFLMLTQIRYNKEIENAGELIVKQDGKLLFQLDEQKTDLETLGEKKEIRFKVERAAV